MASTTTKHPSRREQRELDELLSDIYKGIEQLPDTNGKYVHVALSPASAGGSRTNQQQQPRHLFAKQIREYELPANSALVRQHKQELTELSRQQQKQGASKLNTPSHSYSKPLHSSLKRQTPEASQQEHQSLASFMSNSLTPENRRRVRILDDRGSSSSQQHNNNNNNNNKDNKQNKVKYINTNKFIYHQEKNPDDDNDNDDENAEVDVDLDSDYHTTYNADYEASDYPASENASSGRRALTGRGRPTNVENSDDDDDLDGVTRVEYYHTSWLDRQLGRANRRRDSKELNERQVKEKAMIEELKRNLKNGAITLRRSLKGGGGGANNSSSSTGASTGKNSAGKQSSFSLFPQKKPTKTSQHETRVLSPIRDNNIDQSYQKKSNRSVFGSGLATLPRNRIEQDRKPQVSQRNTNHQESHKSSYMSGYSNSGHMAATSTPPKQVTTTITSSQVDPLNNPYSSRTLPHNYPQHQKLEQQYTQQVSPAPSYQSSSVQSRPHQLIQQHSKTGSSPLSQRSYNTLGPNYNFGKTQQQQQPQQYSATNKTYSNTMRNPAYNSNNNCANGVGQHNNMQSNNMTPVNQHQQQQQHQETISGLPSATDVVRSALSRSSSQVSLNQLNKTINLLPETPPGHRNTPMTPTQHLKAATPSLSPSPVPFNAATASPAPYGSRQATSPCYTSKTMPSPARQQHQPISNQQPITRLHGTRIIEKPNQPPAQPQQQHQRQQPVYANPHASLMQHRMEQQMRQPNKNVASIREFNELDSLLRSLSPRAGTTTSITPGFSSRPAQASFGGYMPANQQPPQTNRPITGGLNDVYARVQKQPGNYLQQHQLASNNNNNNIVAANVTQPPAHSEPFVVDVTNKNKEVDENCLRRPQNLSEFEPSIDILPSMEDYQNISKLNPVKNHYWYKPNMSRDRAISLLKDKPQGTFIVRDSTSFRGAYGLAVKVSKLPKNVLNNANLRSTNGDISSELIRHFLIEPTSNGVRLKGYANEPVFGSLPSLIYQHSLTELALPCRLVIPKADIEDPDFNHKQKRFFDEFVASKEMAKHAPYETTSPNGGYRKYPGDVYIHNEHRIIFQ